MKEKKTYVAPAIEVQEINQFIVLSGSSPVAGLEDSLVGLGSDQGSL